MSTTNKTYRIVLDGKQYTGTAGDVARWYCQQKGVNLLIENTEDEGVFELFALFRDAKDAAHIEYFDEDAVDIEDCYSAFFEYYLQQVKDLDCTIWEYTQFNTRSGVPNSDEMTSKLIKYMNRLHPERDACLEAAARIACEVMRMDEGTIEDADQYIRIVMKVMRMAYPKLLELRCEKWD